MITKETEL
jgi:chromosome segregation ATPase